MAKPKRRKDASVRGTDDLTSTNARAVDPSTGAPDDPNRATLPSPPPKRGHDVVSIAFFVLLFVSSLAVVLHVLSGYVTDAILGLLLASLLAPVHARLAHLVGGRRWVASLALCLLVVVLALGPMIFVAVTLSSEAADVYQTAKAQISFPAVDAYLFGDGWLATRARQLFGMIGVEYSPDTVKGWLQTALTAIAGFVASHANAVLSNLIGFLFHFVLLLVITFYFLNERARFLSWLRWLSPLPDDEDQLLFDKFTAVGRAILFGNGIGAVGQGVVGGAAMSIAGVPSPVLWGTMMAVAAFLPLVGISVVTIPAALYLVLNERYAAGIVFFVVCTAQGLFFENVVKTRFMGAQMRMHDLVIFLSVLGGIATFGIVGLLYGPLIVALFMVLCALYEERYKPALTRPRE